MTGEKIELPWVPITFLKKAEDGLSERDAFHMMPQRELPDHGLPRFNERGAPAIAFLKCKVALYFY